MRRSTLFFFTFLYAPVAWAQTAQVSGTVKDTSNAVVPNAVITVVSENTGVRRTTPTNSAGIYSVAFLPPGPYRITVEAPGFQLVSRPGVKLEVEQVARIDFTLQVGPVEQTITVKGGVPLVNTESAAVATVVDRQFVENIPLNGRSFQSLIELTPGVVVTASNYQDGGQFSVNGQRSASNYWMVDGVGANIGIGINLQGSPSSGLNGALGSFSALGGTNSLVSVDAMQEFRIQTSTYAPEFGRTPGAQISIATRPGTNQFHGTLFDYLRNDAMDASDWFNGYLNNPPLPKARERQNDFGGTFGGPIRKDSTFFFFSYEGLRLRLPQTTLSTVPDLSARQNAVGVMQPYLNAFPLPNGPSVSAGAARFNASYSNPATLDAASLRIDRRVGNKLTVFGRYNYSPSEIIARGAGVANALSNLAMTKVKTQTGTLGITWLSSPTSTNDFRFNYSKTDSSNSYRLDNFGGAVPLTTLPFPSQFGGKGILDMVIISLQQNNLEIGDYGHNEMQQFNFVDSHSLQRGSHALKFGGDYRRLSPFAAKVPYLQEPVFFTVPSAQNGSLGLAVLATNEPSRFLFRNLGIYAQDTWRTARHFTLTYGLRWDVDFTPRSIAGPNFSAVTGFTVNDPSHLALASSGSTPYKTSYRSFAPRIGVAYELSQSHSWESVVRGGFGVFYDLATTDAGNCDSNGYYPFGNVSTLTGGTFPLDPAKAVPPATPLLGSLTICAFDPNLRLPHTLEWNIAVEQALGDHQTVSASYIGAAGRSLLQTARAVSPNANLGSADLISNLGTSDYDALQIQFQRRVSRGLQILASYTWSHSIDTASAGSAALASNSVAPGDPNLNRGPSDFDIRHAFSAGISYDIPAPVSYAFTKAILRGWSAENVIQIYSAAPVDIRAARLAEFSGSVLSTDVRPDLVPGQPVYLCGSQYPGRKAFNTDAFTNPPIDPNTRLPQRQGNVPRNFLRGFAAGQWDFAVHRDFPVHESLKLQFRAEMFNVLNHPNFGQPSGAWGRSGFGVSSKMLAQYLNGGSTGVSNLGSGAFSPLYQIGGPRSVQLGLKLMF